VIKLLISILVRIAKKQHSRLYRLSSLIFTIGLIFVFFPFLYLYTGRYIENIIQLPTTSLSINFMAIVFLLMGGILIIWTLILQYGYGKGSGSHMAAPQKLIVIGPYKLCRHPMLLGAIFFYFGTGTLQGSIIIGLYGAIITAVLAYFFVLYIEEPVLIARFGEQYKKYQKEVPLIPFLLTSFNYCNRKHKSHN